MDFLFCIDWAQLYLFGHFFRGFSFSKTASLWLEPDEPNSRILASAAITGPSVSRHNRQAIGIKIATRRVHDHTKPPCKFVQNFTTQFWETVVWSGENVMLWKETTWASPFNCIDDNMCDFPRSQHNISYVTILVRFGLRPLHTALKPPRKFYENSQHR